VEFCCIVRICGLTIKVFQRLVTRGVTHICGICFILLIRLITFILLATQTSLTPPMSMVMINILLLIQPSNLKYNGSINEKILIFITCWYDNGKLPLLDRTNLAWEQSVVVGYSWNCTHFNHGAPHGTLQLDDQTVRASYVDFMFPMFVVRTIYIINYWTICIRQL
jgi:hypothetical protein